LGAIAAEVGGVQAEFLCRGCPEGLTRVYDHAVLCAIDIESHPPHVLRQRCRALALRRRLALRRWLRLGWRGGSRSLRDDRSTWSSLRNWLWRWNGLYSLSSGNSDTARDYRGGRHAEACARDEIAAGDNRSSAFFSGFRVVAC
jgi:hypothetical protein